MNTLTINNLTKTYNNGVKALNDLSLEIGNGMFGLLGPNGAGKSSLMNMIAGLQQPDNGEIFFNKENIVKNPDAIKLHLGFLPQDFGVYPKVSAFDLLNHIALLKGVSDKQSRHEQILALLDRTNLYAQRKRDVYRFSGGMRQRFGIAQALLGDPLLIIVDEPTAGLDPEERSRFNNLLSEIGEERIVILSTHLVEDVRNLCSEMAVMSAGKIIAKGKPADFINRLNGKIWHKLINKPEKEKHEQHYKVISTQWINGKLDIHIYSEAEPCNDFRAVQPSLEDVYFNLLPSIATQ